MSGQEVQMAQSLMNQANIPGLPSPDDGQTLQRMQSKYTTAVTVQQPRDLDKVVAAVMREAEYAGEAFFYSWGEGKNHVEGASVGLCLTVAREWMNCAVETEIEETKEAYIFNAHFVDVEKGFTISRPFRQSKRWNVYGKMDEMRKDDTRFQIGASKAIRNVVKSAVPNWLLEQAIEKAKETVYKGITKDGIAASSEKAISAIGSLGVSEERIIAKLGKAKVQWNTQDIVTLRTAFAAIRDGEAYAEEIFPQVEEQTASVEKAPPKKKEEPKPKTEEEKPMTRGQKAAATRAANKAKKEAEAKAKAEAEKSAKEQEAAKVEDQAVEQSETDEASVEFKSEPKDDTVDTYGLFNVKIEEAGIDPGKVVEFLQNMKNPQLAEGQTLKDLTEAQLENFVAKWDQFSGALIKYIEAT